MNGTVLIVIGAILLIFAAIYPFPPIFAIPASDFWEVRLNPQAYAIASRPFPAGKMFSVMTAGCPSPCFLRMIKAAAF